MDEKRDQSGRPREGAVSGPGADNVVTLSRDDIVRARMKRARRSMVLSAQRMRDSAASLRRSSMRLDGEREAMQASLRKLDHARAHLDEQRDRAQRIMREAEEVQRLCDALE